MGEAEVVKMPLLPLSPSLFAPAIEPTAVALRTSAVVKALKVGSIRKCTALYADDMLLFLEDPGSSLEAVFETLGNFARFLRSTGKLGKI